jgi:predicted amidohydrolase YtcJ
MSLHQIEAGQKAHRAHYSEWLPFELPTDTLQNMRAEGGTTDPWLKTGALKGFLDGALGTRTAALLTPYSDDPSTSGILRMDRKLRGFCRTSQDLTKIPPSEFLKTEVLRTVVGGHTVYAEN